MCFANANPFFAGQALVQNRLVDASSTACVARLRDVWCPHSNKRGISHDRHWGGVIVPL